MKHLVLALCLTTGLAQQAAAGYFTSSGVSVEEYYRNQTEGIEASRSVGDYWRVGATSSSASTALPLTRGSASISLLNDPGIRLSAVAESGPDPLGNWVYQGYTYTGARWQDVIRVSGAAPPSTLRVVFSVEGSFGFDLGVLGSGDARFGMLVFPDPNNTYDFSDDASIPAAWAAANAWPESGVAAGASNFPSENSYLGPSGITTDLQSFPDGSVTWDASYELWYDPELGGYEMSFYASLFATSFDGGRTDADFGSTIRLTALTDDDGSPLEGTVTFDSGFSLGNTPNPVPEPGTMSLFAMGVLGVILQCRRTAKARSGAQAR